MDPRHARAHLLLTDAAAFDEPLVRAAAADRGWEIAIETLTGEPVAAIVAPGPRRFAEILRLRLIAMPGAREPDAAALLRALGMPAWLALDAERRVD